MLMYLRCAGLTPLILASAAGHVDVCEVLLQHKCDIDNVSDKNKDTALSLACSNGRLEVNNTFQSACYLVLLVMVSLLQQFTEVADVTVFVVAIELTSHCGCLGHQRPMLTSQ